MARTGSAKLRRELDAVKTRGAPVRIWRREIESEVHSEGFVIDATPALVLLNKVSDRIHLDGFEVIRTADVTEIRTEWRARAFLERALELKGVAPRRPAAPIDLASMRAAVVSASAAYPLIAVFRETVFPDECDIGLVREESRKGFRMHWMNVAARWEWDSEIYLWGEVTRLEFDNEYERTLAMVAEADGSVPVDTPGGAG